MRRAWVVIAVVCVAAGVVTLRSLRRPSGPRPNRNVILVLLDTVRADRLGAYGNLDGLTPNLDRFARQAVRFERAYSHAPWTLPSVASLFTSMVPTQHGAGGRLGDFRKLREDVPTLAEVFRHMGARTAEIINVMFLTDTFGMTRGFDDVDAQAPDSNEVVRRAGPTTDAALAWLDRQRSRDPDQPFFLFVHYFDAHLTYDPPPEFRRRFADPADRNTTVQLFGTRPEMVNLRAGLISLDPALIRRLEKLYNAEVAYIDSEVGRFFDGLTRRGLDDNTVVVVTADHGEEFLDHGGFEHGHTLYNELLHVPLMIRTPRMASTTRESSDRNEGRLVYRVVRQIDLAPTLCELAGISGNPTFTGESVASYLVGHDDVDRPVLSEGNMWGPSGAALRTRGLEIIRSGEGGTARLYDADADPKEQRDLAPQGSERLERMQKDLDLLLRVVTARAVTTTAPDLSEADRERLRSLGYLKE